MPDAPADSSPLVLLVGHCGFDSGGLSTAAERALPDARVERVNSQEALDAKRGEGVVLLVNRVLDGRFDASDGVGLIRKEAAKGGVKALLVSNFEKSQAEAEEAGGLPGFGKDDVGTPVAVQRIRAAASARGA